MTTDLADIHDRVLQSAEIVIDDTEAVPEPQWLYERRLGITSGDAAAALGLSPYDTPTSLFYRKKGELPAPEDNEYMELGRFMERPIGLLFEKRTGKATVPFKSMLQSKRWPYMRSNHDFVVLEESALVEAKNVGAHMVREWEIRDGDDVQYIVPDHYGLQGQHELAVSGLDAVYFAVLVGGQHFIHVRVERDDELIEVLAEKELAFWNLLMNTTPPDVDASPRTTAALKARFADTVEGGVVELPDSAAVLLDRRDQLKAEVKSFTTPREKEIDYIENSLRAWLGENEIGTIEGHEVVTYKKLWRKPSDGYSYRKFWFPNKKGEQ